MIEVQEKLLELLKDIDTICKREGIAYSLSAETAHAAVMTQAFYPDCCEASVAMTTDNARKFMAAVKKENRDDRIVDSMLTNKGYPDFTLRYGDPNTVMMELPYKASGALPCIGVTIHMVRRKPLVRKRFYRFSSAFWKACHLNAASYPGFVKRAGITACHVVKKVFGEKNISRWLFKSWCCLFSANKNAKKVAVGAGKFNLDADLLDYQDTVMLEGTQFPVFGYVDSYLNKAYGCSNFRKVKPKYRKPSASLLISKRVPYQKYLERAKENGVDFASVNRNQQKLDKLKKLVSADNKKIEKYYAIVFRTEKRFAMYEKYMPMKKLLLKLHEEKRYEELNELLKPYRSVLWDCYRKGLGLCFDKDIFEITMDILRMEGSYSYVQKLRAMVPQQHWEPMTVTDYKGELVEVTDISEVLPQFTGEAEEPVQ